MDTLFQVIFAKFREAFPPADENNYSLKLTSAEVYKIFSSFYPNPIDESKFFELMLMSGYTYAPEERTGTINFYWLLQKNN